MIKAVFRLVGVTLAGGGMGTFAALYHRLYFPFGVVAVLIASAMALFMVRKLVLTYSAHRWFGAGLVASVILYASGDAMTSSLIILDAPGLVLVLGTATMLFVSLGWPDFRERQALGT